MKMFSVYEEPSYAQRLAKVELGQCVSEEHKTKEEAIEKAEQVFLLKAVDNDEWGKGDASCILYIYDDETGNETIEPVTIEWEAEKDNYDGGRFDYISSR